MNGSPLSPAYDALIRARHAAFAHVRTHTVGQTCPQCGVVVLDDRVTQAAYEHAWHELFDGSSPRGGEGATAGG